MPRRAVPIKVVRDQLIALTNAGLGRDVRFIVDHIAFQKRVGEPNWDAVLRIQALDIIDVFTKVVRQIQQQFDIAW